jgi:hypothetical protein
MAITSARRARRRSFFSSKDTGLTLSIGVPEYPPGPIARLPPRRSIPPPRCST